MNVNFYKYKFYFIFSLILNLSNIYLGNSEEQNSKNFILIPFKSYFPKLDFSPNVNKALINSWVRRKLYLDIENESRQKMQIILNTQEPQMHTRDVIALIRTEDKYYEPYNINDKDICTFNYKNSNSYELTTEYNHSFYSIYNTCYAKEKIFLYNNFNLIEKKLYNIEFIHSSNETHICFFGGLQLTESPIDLKINLFYQIKHLINSQTYTWSLIFTTPNEGFFIFGDIINNNKIHFYNDNIEDNYISLNIPAYSLSTITWKLYFEKIYFDDYVIKTDSQLYFYINFQIRYITVPKKYFYDIKSKYFLTDDSIENTKKKFICFEEEIEFFFHGIYCHKKEYIEITDNYKKLPTLNLYGYKLGINITFTPKDLFLEKDDKIYFYIAYNQRQNDDWYMGSIFLEKYITIFDNEAKKLNILKISDNKKEENKEVQSNKFKIIIIIILVFILSALIFSFLGMIFGKKLYKQRKKKANELDDEDFDYSPKIIK